MRRTILSLLIASSLMLQTLVCPAQSKSDQTSNNVEQIKEQLSHYYVNQKIVKIKYRLSYQNKQSSRELKIKGRIKKMNDDHFIISHYKAVSTDAGGYVESNIKYEEVISINK